MSFRSITAAALAPIAAVAMVATPAPVEAAKPTIDLVEKHLASVRSMTADFTQTDRKGRSISGKLLMKRPGKVRFDYGRNADMLMVSEGNQLHFIDYEVGQKSSWDIQDTPMSVLLDQKPDLNRIARIVPSKNENVVIVRARDARRPEFGTLIFAFYRDNRAPGGLVLEGWTAIDAQNKRTVVRLDNQRYNVAVNDGRFAYRDPK
ncbi:LolA family protein [Sphingomicrobium clamense]|uniref:Outer membrane lipoprotein carrier protein LolA n=1 Tax=Sphingomicrobium clamense TaxID=2851013 RepID=A0ABS6V318_9SPHN|nr:outer membrane lipoprotein carrier protein LolA [Sphingomicrobium sp. B8]MBW0143954.1 outer membrane lipoprotein carrier protein LolA [Sphingomicrobium sp. B8]